MHKTQPETKTEASCLERDRIRLISENELAAWNALVDQKHYLCARLVGPPLRYVAEVAGQWVGLMRFGQGAYHLQAREDFIGWTDVQRGRRLNLLAQNTRFVLLHECGQYPNLAARIISLANKRLSADWQQQFGSPVVAVETFVDPLQNRCRSLRSRDRPMDGRVGRVGTALHRH